MSWSHNFALYSLHKQTTSVKRIDMFVWSISCTIEWIICLWLWHTLWFTCKYIKMIQLCLFKHCSQISSCLYTCLYTVKYQVQITSPSGSMLAQSGVPRLGYVAAKILYLFYDNSWILKQISAKNRSEFCKEVLKVHVAYVTDIFEKEI